MPNQINANAFGIHNSHHDPLRSSHHHHDQYQTGNPYNESTDYPHRHRSSHK